MTSTNQEKETNNSSENIEPKDISSIINHLSEEDYPKLGFKVDDSKNKKYHPYITPKKKDSQVIVVGHKSFYENKKSKNLSIQDNIKTKLCFSLKLKKLCIHGNKCKYAHSKDELNIKNCSFNDNCNKIKKECDGKIVNNGSICFYIHPGETKEEFFSRTGMKNLLKSKSGMLIPSQVMISQKKKNLDQIGDSCYKMEKIFSPRQKDEEVKITDEDQLEINNFLYSQEKQCQKGVYYNSEALRLFTFYCQEYNPYRYPTKTYIKVPKDLASKALEMAINSGKKDIRIEIL
jgi:hypothetical protein